MSQARSLRIALTQTPSSSDTSANLRTLVTVCEEAAQRADLILLPENALYAGSQQQMRDRPFSSSSPEIRALQETAARRSSPIILGGVKWREEETISNRALVFGADGAIAAWYDKAHGFAAQLGGVAFDAAQAEQPGDRLVMIEYGGLRLGLAICFDMRFPDMFRRLALAGADVLLLPSAFTRITGRAHWEPLLRARAIDNGAYVVASATISDPAMEDTDPRACWGHALAVGPWGEVLADLGEAQAAWKVITLEASAVAEARRRMPSLQRRRESLYETTPIVTSLSAVNTGETT